MKTLAVILASIALVVAVTVLTTGVAMVVIGAVGHWFDNPIYMYMGFWDTFWLTIILGFLGYGAGSSK